MKLDFNFSGWKAHLVAICFFTGVAYYALLFYKAIAFIIMSVIFYYKYLNQ